MDRDREHLRLLALFHYILGGLTAATSLVFVIHLVIGVLMVTGAIGDGDDGARVVGIFLLVLGVALIALMLGFAALLILAGRALAQHRAYTFCLVIAALQCLNAPFGTALGVFTILVLQRESVRELFGNA